MVHRRHITTTTAMGLVVIPGVATSSFAVSSSVSCSFAFNSNFQRSADASISSGPLYHLPITSSTHHRKTRSCLQLTTLHGTSSQSSFTTTTSKKRDSSTAFSDETFTIKTITKEQVSRMSLSQLTKNAQQTRTAAILSAEQSTVFS